MLVVLKNKARNFMKRGYALMFSDDGVYLVKGEEKIKFYSEDKMVATFEELEDGEVPVMCGKQDYCDYI